PSRDKGAGSIACERQAGQTGPEGNHSLAQSRQRAPMRQGVPATLPVLGHAEIRGVTRSALTMFSVGRNGIPETANDTEPQMTGATRIACPSLLVEQRSRENDYAHENTADCTYPTIGDDAGIGAPARAATLACASPPNPLAVTFETHSP